MDIKVCTCAHCRNKKSGLSKNLKKIIKRMISKKRRIESRKVYNHYFDDFAILNQSFFDRSNMIKSFKALKVISIGQENDQTDDSNRV